MDPVRQCATGIGQTQEDIQKSNPPSPKHPAGACVPNLRKDAIPSHLQSDLVLSVLLQALAIMIGGFGVIYEALPFPRGKLTSGIGGGNPNCRFGDRVEPIAWVRALNWLVIASTLCLKSGNHRREFAWS
jgi:hypothetical protein